MWHIVTTFWFSVCVFCWLMTCALSIFSVLDNFCQISPLHSNAVWITRVLHLICNAHTHIAHLFGSKFHIILAMYVQILDICIENIKKSKISDIFDIFENITTFSNPDYAALPWEGCIKHYTQCVTGSSLILVLLALPTHNSRTPK